MKVFYNLKIQFKGTRYQGWQIQPNLPTVQGSLNAALMNIFKTEDIHSTGSGRTDAGVHALDFLVKIEVPFKIIPKSLVKAINANLPSDIRVIDAVESNKDFLPTNHAKSKEYIYRFSNLASANAFQEDFIPNVSNQLDFEKMKKACELFVGKHDFKDFQCTGSEVKTTIREIFDCKLIYVSQEQLEGIYPPHFVFRVVGNGFLKQMVRLMVGTLWSVGKNKVDLMLLEEALRCPCGYKLGPVAPPNGLVKLKVTY